MQEHHVLILGAGWSTTTRDGRKVAGADTIKWSFDPEEDDAVGKDQSQFSVLPSAKYVLITFPLTGHGQSKKIVEGYQSVWKGRDVGFIQFGSTGIWQIEGQSCWVDRHSRYNEDNARAIAEDELLCHGGCVMNLAGLWGGERQPKTWVGRVAKSKDDVKSKKSLHMIHGEDVARAMLAICEKWQKSGKGQRWMITDGFVYDWWALFAGWADVSESDDKNSKDGDPEPSHFAKWVYELMVEENVKALPRSNEELGRCYDVREFWRTFGIAPLKARI